MMTKDDLRSKTHKYVSSIGGLSSPERVHVCTVAFAKECNKLLDAYVALYPQVDAAFWPTPLPVNGGCPYLEIDAFLGVLYSVK